MKISHSILSGNKHLPHHLPFDGSGLAREVPMNSPILAILVMMVIVIGSTLTAMNRGTEPAKTVITRGALQCLKWYGTTPKREQRCIVGGCNEHSRNNCHHRCCAHSWQCARRDEQRLQKRLSGFVRAYFRFAASLLSRLPDYDCRLEIASAAWRCSLRSAFSASEVATLEAPATWRSLLQFAAPHLS